MERWVKAKEHGRTSHEADTLLSFLRDIANSPSPTSSDLSIVYHYQKHVDSLNSAIYMKEESTAKGVVREQMVVMSHSVILHCLERHSKTLK